MEFGLFSNGFRPHTSASETFAKDLREIVFADKLGLRYAFISEHHGEPIYINKADTLPVPELLMCKASALTTQIKFSAAVNTVHLQHPLDVAEKTATADHMIGDGRFIFGFGSGFPNPALSTSRGLPYEGRQERMMESLELIQKCWATEQPFDWNGKHWQGKDILCSPKPLNGKDIPMAVATETPDMMALAGERGYYMLNAYFDTARVIRGKADIYARAGAAAGREAPLKRFAVSRSIYLANNRKEALDDVRDAINYELSFQKRRGLLNLLRKNLAMELSDDTGFDEMVENGTYLIGEPDDIAEKLRRLYDESGGFGILLLLGAKEWATPEKRERSMQLFMDEIAPTLADLVPDRVPDEVAA